MMTVNELVTALEALGYEDNTPVYLWTTEGMYEVDGVTLNPTGRFVAVCSPEGGPVTVVDSETAECPGCQGRGRHAAVIGGMTMRHQVPCGTCDGSGRVKP